MFLFWAEFFDRIKLYISFLSLIAKTADGKLQILFPTVITIHCALVL